MLSLLASAQDFYFDNEKHHFGYVVSGQKLIHKFKLINDSSQPVTIESVSAANSSIQFEYTQTPIMPHHSGFVKITYPTANLFSGGSKKGITVQCNGKNKRLTFSYYILEDEDAENCLKENNNNNDLMTFDLKGSVKTCIWTSSVNMYPSRKIHPFGDSLSFSPSGTYINKNLHISRYKGGRIRKIVKDKFLWISYVYNNDGYVKNRLSQYETSFLTTKSIYSRENLKEEHSSDNLSRELFPFYYDYIKFDSHGNWIERRVKTKRFKKDESVTLSLIFGVGEEEDFEFYEKREIIYYDSSSEQNTQKKKNGKKTVTI